jgi:hypothetical protein
MYHQGTDFAEFLLHQLLRKHGLKDEVFVNQFHEYVTQLACLNKDRMDLDASMFFSFFFCCLPQQGPCGSRCQYVLYYAIYIYIYLSIYIYISTHTHIHIHTHMYVHTYIHKESAREREREGGVCV